MSLLLIRLISQLLVCDGWVYRQRQPRLCVVLLADRKRGQKLQYNKIYLMANTGVVTSIADLGLLVHWDNIRFQGPSTPKNIFVLLSSKITCSLILREPAAPQDILHTHHHQLQHEIWSRNLVYGRQMILPSAAIRTTEFKDGAVGFTCPFFQRFQNFDGYIAVKVIKHLLAKMGQVLSVFRFSTLLLLFTEMLKFLDNLLFPETGWTSDFYITT